MATPARPRLDSGYFFQQIANAERSVLVLDFDSALRSARPRPALSLVPTVEELLECIIMARRTQLIVTSQRSARDVLAHFRPPYPEIWGKDGLESVPAAGTATAAVPFCIRPRPQTGMLTALLTELRTRGPVAYVVGVRADPAADRVLVRPEFHLSPTEASLGEAEDLLQFLTDWLRACAGEIC